MNISDVRPEVAELTFQVFGRPVHPELFNTRAQSEIHHEAYSARLQVCDTGHVITFRRDKNLICEVATSRESPLPLRKKLYGQKLKGHKQESICFESGLEYHISFQLEQLEPEVFLHFHQELFIDSHRAFVAHQFTPATRWTPVPVSFMKVEDSPRSLLVHAFHTFPENFAVVKTQSLFEF